MGSDAEAHVFDHERYISLVVPAVRSMLLTGRVEDWLRKILLRAQENDLVDRSVVGLLGGADLARDCTYLNADLSIAQPLSGNTIWFDEWNERACSSSQCPSHTRCPFHMDGPACIAEVSFIIEQAVAWTCLDGSQFLGRSFNTGRYHELLCSSGIEQTHPLRKLLDALGMRGWVMGHQFSNSDGIHGWLDVEESRALHTLLGNLPLPTMQESFQAMQAMRMYDGYMVPEGATWEALSLSFLRATAGIAVKQGRGILWGNDVVPLPSA